MKIRHILVILALLSLVSTTTGGGIYFHAFRAAAKEEAEAEARKNLEQARREMVSYFKGYRHCLKLLSTQKEIRQWFSTADGAARARANAVLDLFKETLRVEVCYLMDRHGRTIASSNRNGPDSFVGKSYAFRPYFRQAMAGTTSLYMARGITSKKRGIYLGHPVRIAPGQPPAGVAVIKLSAGRLDLILARFTHGIWLLASARGMVFSSNQKDFQFKLLWPASSAVLQALARSRQFGPGPWAWTGLSRTGPSTAQDRPGNHYRIFQTDLPGTDGWQLIHLCGHASPPPGAILGPVARTTGYAVLAICLCIGTGVAFLYRTASRELDEKTADLKKAWNRAEAASRAKSRFMAVMSHELRTPLNAIVGFSEILAEQSDGAQARYAENIAKSGQRLSGLVDSILTLVDAEDGRLVLKPIRLDVDHAIRAATGAVAAELAEKQIGLALDLDPDLPAVWADPDRIRSILDCLVENAVKFTPAKGAITVLARMAPKDGPMLQVSVRDSGIGFDPGDRERIFARFAQADASHTRRYQGAGLGLALAKTLVELHGGKIWAESPGTGQGATVAFSIPAGVEPASPS